MGIYVQILWNAAQGRPFLSTLLEESTNHLAEHVALALWPLVPLAGLAPDAIPLLILQQLFLAAAGLPVYLTARPRVGRGAALLVLLGFFLMPAISRVSLSEFHPVVLAALPVAAGAACALAGRPRSAALLLLFGLLFEEEVAPTAAGVGALLLLHHLRGHTRHQCQILRPALALLLCSALWGALVVTAILPAFRPRAERAAGNRAASHYTQVLDNPAIAAHWLLNERGPDALAWLLLPNGGVALLAPEILLVVLPGLTVLFLQDRAGTYAGHWSAPVLPVIWLAVGVGLGRLVRRPILLKEGLALMAAGTLIAYPLDSYFPGGREYEPDHYWITDHERDLQRAVALVPPEASLVATRRIVPHLAARSDLYQFPFTFYSAPLRPSSWRKDVYLLDLTDSPTQRALDAGEADSVLEKKPRYHVHRFGAAVLLLTRDRPEPAEQRQASFGGVVRLLGLSWPEGRPSNLRAATPLTVQLFWDSPRPPGDHDEAQRSLQLVDQRGVAVARLEGEPLDHYLPLRDWERGQVVAEQARLWLPPTLPAGVYRLVVGWSLNGTPLPIDGTADALLELGRFELS